jgi:enterochelin esterase family protein
MCWHRSIQRPPTFAFSGSTEDSLIKPNRKLVDFLKTKEMPVTQIETPGLHTWLVWRDNLIHFTPLLFQQK